LLKKISVIIPTCNRQRELIQSIRSVINQSYIGEIEIIIVDDSIHSNKKIIENEFSTLLKNNRSRKIIYIHKAKKEGSPVARNIGIQKSNGEFIAFLDDDDLWLPEKIKKQVDLLEKEKDVSLVICYSLDKRFGRERINRPPKFISHETVLNAFNLSSTSSYLMRKDVIYKLGGFDIKLPSAQEYDLAIRLSKEHKIRCVPEVLMIQQSTQGQISEDWNKKIKGLVAIYSKHKRDYYSSSKINHLKFIGMLGLFTIGYLIGDKIYNLIIPMKELYEE